MGNNHAGVYDFMFLKIIKILLRFSFIYLCEHLGTNINNNILVFHLNSGMLNIVIILKILEMWSVLLF